MAVGNKGRNVGWQSLWDQCGHREGQRPHPLASSIARRKLAAEPVSWEADKRGSETGGERGPEDEASQSLAAKSGLLLCCMPAWIHTGIPTPAHPGGAQGTSDWFAVVWV